MNQLIEELIDKGMGRIIDESRDELAQTDVIYGWVAHLLRINKGHSFYRKAY